MSMRNVPKALRKAKEITYSITEADFKRQVRDLAKLLGWLCWTHWISVHSPPGWPDLALCREQDGTARGILLELKRQEGKLTPAQAECLALWDQVPGITARCIRPSDWDALVELLR